MKDGTGEMLWAISAHCLSILKRMATLLPPLGKYFIVETYLVVLMTILIVGLFHPIILKLRNLATKRSG
jgi:NhaP-type Na+/H+ or K+/H+ antiporter